MQMSLTGPAKLSDKLYEGTRNVRTNALSISLTGDIASLSGRTLFAVIEVGDPIFETSPQISIGVNSAAVQLVGRNNVPKGHYTGTARLFACLDPACTSQLVGSPLSVPYDVEVLAGFALSQETVTFKAPFGTEIPPAEVTFLNLPAPLDVTFSDLWLSSRELKLDRTASNKVVVTPTFGAVPGTYTKTTTVTAFAPDPTFPTENAVFNKTLTASYTVDPTDAPFFLIPTAATHTFSLSQSTLKKAAGSFAVGLQNPGSLLGASGFRYDAAPLAAAGHPEVNNWLVRTSGVINEYDVSACGWTSTETNCLPVGTYKAAIPLQIHAPTGALTQLDFPITMIITP